MHMLIVEHSLSTAPFHPSTLPPLPKPSPPHTPCTCPTLQLVEQNVIADTFGLCFGYPGGGPMVLGGWSPEREGTDVFGMNVS